MAKETMEFKTEVQHLLDLMIHSLYSNKDIYQRELLANAADAIDKARFESLTNPAITQDWHIRIAADKETNTITISDNGIGMNHDEIINNIGTIAKSGTKAFLKQLEESSEADRPELIGQFGVGFYSTFMVADKVELITKRAGGDSPAYIWTSTGVADFTLEETEKDGQGTDIIIHLKEDAADYADEWKIRSIVKKYSDFIEHPVIMNVTKTEKDPEDEEKEIEISEDETLNSQKAIWLRPASEITEEDHKNFFQHLSPMSGEPMKTIQFTAEGKAEFKSLLYIPSQAPFDMFNAEGSKHGLHLYIRRVFISDDCKELMPEYLRFVKGVVDSSDLPLNVSREILQESAKLKQIEKNLVRKVLSELKKMKTKDHDNYLKFWSAFGKVIKEGVHTDFANKEKITDLLLFETMGLPAGELVSLKEYVDAMPEKQKEIYYLTGDSREQIENSPHLEYLKSLGYDVLFLTDPIDEWVVQSVTEYDEKPLKSAGKGDIELDEDTKKEADEKKEKAEKEHKELIEFLKTELSENIKDVRFSQRLTESACCLVADQYDPSANMERIFKAMNQDMPKSKRILELNADHALVQSFQKLYDKESANPKLKDFAGLLYDQALLTEGSAISDPLQFTRQISELMVLGLEKAAE